MPVDADNDGLLDLYVGVEGSAGHLLRNSGDGTFRYITAAAGLSGAVDVRQALVSDLDNDGFLDLVLMRGSAPLLVYVNQGGAQFADRSARAGLPTASSIFAVDLDHDGNFDLVLWTATGPAAFHNRGDASFSRVALPEYAGARAGVVADVDGDGFDDLLFAGADGQWHLLANRGGSFREEPVQVPAGVAPIHAAAAWLNRPRDLDLIQTDAEGALAVWRRQPPESGWIEVALQGAKSNAQGVGAVVEIKAGNFYQKVMATGGPVRVFTGSLPKVDVVRVTWPNALVQNVVNSATGKRVAVRESERMASSCPFVYAWNGTEYEFVTDVLGASPLGELAPDGTLLAPNSREYVRLPAWIQPRNGLYTFQFTSEMREVDYFDGAHLVAVDHAAGEEIYANEIYASTPTAPALYRVRDRHAPAAATTDGDRDVLPPLTRRDGHYVGGFRRTRIPGMAELHELTIDLGSAARAPHVSLWLTGWVFWPDSNSARALSAQKTHMVGPYLQVRDAQGRWVTVIEDMGLPSGTNRSLRVDLTGKFLSEDRQVRIVTNLCVYWDEAFFATDEEALRPFAEVLPAHADLHYRGFATPESDPGGVRPDHLEYARLDAEVPWNPAAGRYTRYGNVQRLVTAPDDRIVVMAPGDELTVSFPASSLPPPAPGRQRQWFLLLDGWAKDNEPNTVTGNTSGPLPYRAMKSYPYSRDEALGREAYVRQYQTRPRRAWIPPLAPLAGANTR